MRHISQRNLDACFVHPLLYIDWDCTRLLTTGGTSYLVALVKTSTVTHFDLALFNKTRRKMISCCLGSHSLVTCENGSNEDFLINLAHRGCYSWPRCFSWRVRLAKMCGVKLNRKFNDKLCQVICGCTFIKSRIMQGNGLNVRAWIVPEIFRDCFKEM